MDIIEYHKSIARELEATKNRIRNLMDNPHWLSDGEWKESVLRYILRRHMPETTNIGRGFIFTHQGCSEQIDILIYDRSKPVLFKDGDLVFITPDAVKGIIEVKSKVNNNSLSKALSKLSEKASIVRNNTRSNNDFFVGLFSYDYNSNASNLNRDHIIADRVLNLLKNNANSEPNRIINHLCLGNSFYYRFWENYNGQLPQNQSNRNNIWIAYKLENLAPAFFINNLISSVSHSVMLNKEAWFPLSKEGYMINSISLDD